MKHYTSSELIRLMANIGYTFDKRAARKGKIAFHTSDWQFSTHPMKFSTRKNEIVFYTVNDWQLNTRPMRFSTWKNVALFWSDVDNALDL